MKLVAKTYAGLEEILSKEIADIGGENIQITKRGVLFEGEKDVLYRANYELRTALRILISLTSFKAENETVLYKKIREVEWWRIMDLNQTFAVDAITRSEVFKHSHYAALKVKDAIADQFRDKMNRRPNVDPEKPDVRVNVHIHNTDVSLSLDSSGDPLYKRGYRVGAMEAPLSEVLADGLLLLSSWDREKPLTDGMCGSGTLPIEAAFLATNTPPQLKRTYFCFKRYKDFDEKLWNHIVENNNNQRIPLKTPISGTDWSQKAVQMAWKNVESAGFRENVFFKKHDFFDLKPPQETGVLIMNPPYDARLKLDDAIAFHKQIGDALKHNWKGWTAWILSGNLEAAKFIGLRPTRKIALNNGAIECKFLKFDLY
jgi:putative N6-adenine-specific DNA methylase